MPLPGGAAEKFGNRYEDVGPCRASWMSWMKRLTRYGWNLPGRKSKGSSSGSRSKESGTTTKLSDKLTAGIGHFIL